MRQIDTFKSTKYNIGQPDCAHVYTFIESLSSLFNSTPVRLHSHFFADEAMKVVELQSAAADLCGRSPQ
jgi:hypothetical protein